MNGKVDVKLNDLEMTKDRDVNNSVLPHKLTMKERLMRGTPCHMGCLPWLKKYFCQGQSLNDEQQLALAAINDDDPLFRRVIVRHRRLIGFLIPSAAFQFFYWSYMIRYDMVHVFETRYFLSLTMIFGSLVAGLTSEAGGAIAFPVMTLAYSITPTVARDVSMMLQSCGMSAASFCIFFMKVTLEYHSLAFCSIGAVAGLIFGLEIVDPALTAAQKKMGFVSIWFSFAFALFLLNRHHKRRTFDSIPNFNWWKMLVLIFTGFCGGIFTSFAGSGVDICSFSILTVLFRISEKIATPTSVVLMATNSCVGFIWRYLMQQTISEDAYNFWLVVIPVVTIGAPLGSVIGTHFHRQVLAACVYVIDTVALISAFILVKQTPALAGVSVAIIVGGFIFFYILTKIGERMLRHIEDEHSIPPLDENEYSIDGLEVEKQGRVNPAY